MTLPDRLRPSPRISYVARDALAGLVGNAAMTVAVATTTAIALTLLGATLLLQRQVDLVTAHVADQVEVTVFLCTGRTCPTPDDRTVDGLAATLAADRRVAAVDYESPEEARDRIAATFTDTPGLVTDVPAEVLPGSFRVTVHDPADAAQVADTYADAVGVETIVDQRELLDTFIGITGVVSAAMAAVAAVQLLIAVTITTNVVRLGTLARAKRMRIMRLVGASDAYVRAPYLAEAAVAATAGAAVAAAVLIVVVDRLTDAVADHVAFLPLVTSTDVSVAAATVAAVGVVLVVATAHLTVRRHTKD